MVYAQIKDGKVNNTIALDNESIKHLFEVGFDALVRIDTISPMPGIGWDYDGESFVAPVQETEE